MIRVEPTLELRSSVPDVFIVVLPAETVAFSASVKALETSHELAFSV